MGRDLKNYEGLKIGPFTVRERSKEIGYDGHRMVWVVCECGDRFSVPVSNVKRRSISCPLCGTEVGRVHHGYSSGDRNLYSRWKGILSRCEDGNNLGYIRYGGRGISVCEEWHKFPNFRDWMIANGYTKKNSRDVSVERVNNDGPYSPDNCKLISRSEQPRNRRNTIWVKDPETGENLCASEYAFKAGVHPMTIVYRVRKGKPLPEKLKNTDVYRISACCGPTTIKTFNTLANVKSWWAQSAHKIASCLRGEMDSVAGIEWYYVTSDGERYKLNKDNEYVRVGD